MRLARLKHRFQPPLPAVDRLHRVHDLARQRVRHPVLRAHASALLPAARAVEVERVEACVRFVVRRWLRVEGSLLLVFLGKGSLGLEEGFVGGGARGGWLVVVAEGADGGGGEGGGGGVDLDFRGVGVGGVGDFFDARVGHVCWW